MQYQTVDHAASHLESSWNIHLSVIFMIAGNLNQQRLPLVLEFRL